MRIAVRQHPSSLDNNLMFKETLMSSSSIYIDDWRRDLIKNPPPSAKMYSKEEWQHIVLYELCESLPSWNKGVPCSEETKQLISKKIKGTNAFVVNGATEAARIRNTGRKQSESHKLNRAKAKSREIEIEGVLYSSGVEAANALGVKKSTISAWAKRNGSRYGISIPVGHNQYTSDLIRGRDKS